MKPYCYTVGHSNYALVRFLDLMEYHNITRVVDVRSVPYSKFVPHYNREELEQSLRQQGVGYTFMGKVLGARDYREGERYLELDQVVQREEFRAGIESVISKIAGGETVVLLCAEKEPFDCHRFSLITYALEGREIEVRHILERGNIIHTQELEDRLIEKYSKGYFQLSLFDSYLGRREVVRQAYSQRFHDNSQPQS